jgi:DNA-directed RNA polymerase sigma subunit (sigma70/sigma32)
MVRLPANVINKLSYLNREIAKFEFINEREPVYGEILDKDNVKMDLLYFPKCVSLNDAINEDGDELIDLIADVDSDENQVDIDYKIKEELNKTLSVLDDREIIENYFGINTL